MSSFERTSHGRYIIKSGPGGGKWQARAFQGVRVVGETETADSREAAIQSIRDGLDRRDAAIVAGRGPDGCPSSMEYAEAFARLGNLHPNYEAMLLAHINAPDRCMTATELARAAGYENFNAANLHYGKLAQQLADELGYNPPRREDGTVMWTYTLATPAQDIDINKMTDAIVRRFDDGHFEWCMRRQVAEALAGR